jgi:hypothetical protein
MRVLFCLAALLCILGAHAFASDRTPGISGEWLYYGQQDGTVRIDEKAAILEDGTTSYTLLEEQVPGGRRVAKKGGSHSGGVRGIFRVHENVLLFPGVKNPILVRKGARFTAPRGKIRGRWHYARQMNEAFYYDAEFDLDAGKMVEISRSASGELMRSKARPFEVLLDAQAELALQADGAVYHFARLGADFLVLEPSYASSLQNGYKILMEKVPRAVKKRTKKGKKRQ